MSIEISASKLPDVMGWCVNGEAVSEDVCRYQSPRSTQPSIQCSRKRGQPLKKNVKSHVLLDFEKNVKSW